MESCDLRGAGGCGQGLGWKSIELGAVEELVMFEHAEDGVQQLAHAGDGGLHFSFPSCQQVLIESTQVGLAHDGHQSGCRA